MLPAVCGRIQPAVREGSRGSEPTAGGAGVGRASRAGLALPDPAAAAAGVPAGEGVLGVAAAAGARGVEGGLPLLLLLRLLPCLRGSLGSVAGALDEADGVEEEEEEEEVEEEEEEDEARRGVQLRHSRPRVERSSDGRIMDGKREIKIDCVVDCVWLTVACRRSKNIFYYIERMWSFSHDLHHLAFFPPFFPPFFLRPRSPVVAIFTFFHCFSCV